MFDIFRKKIFLLLSFCLSLLFTISLVASEKTFDPESKITIVQSSAEVYPPGRVCIFDTVSQAFKDRWYIRYRIDFDNNLYAIYAMIYDNVSYDERFADIKYKGDVNLVFTGTKDRRNGFSLVFEDGKVMSVQLWLDDSDLPIDLPKICSIMFNPQTISHWFYTEEKDEYRLELSDGTFWNVSEPNFLEKIPNVLSTRIIKIGTSSHPILINVDSICKDYPLVREENYFTAEKSE